MRYRALGRTGLSVSVIGFGSLTIGGRATLWGKAAGLGFTDDRESLRAIAQALDEGITLFDTAPSYGNGHAEELLGQGLQGRRRQAIICTKVGMVPCLDPPMKKDFSPSFIRTQIDGCLQRLCTDYLDILLLYRPDDSIFTNEALWKMLIDLKTAGKIRVLGVSTDDMVQATHLVKNMQVEVLQLRYNILDQAAAAIFPQAMAHGVGLIVHTPLALGLLTGRFSPDYQFAVDDYRRTKFATTLRDIVEQVEEFRLLENTGLSLTDAALRFIFSDPAVSSCLVGMRNAAQVVENSAVSLQAELDTNTLCRIRHLWEHRQYCK